MTDIRTSAKQENCRCLNKAALGLSLWGFVNAPQQISQMTQNQAE